MYGLVHCLDEGASFGWTKVLVFFFEHFLSSISGSWIVQQLSSWTGSQFFFSGSWSP
jgi:hypothetical protein